MKSESYFGMYIGQKVKVFQAMNGEFYYGVFTGIEDDAIIFNPDKSQSHHKGWYWYGRAGIKDCQLILKPLSAMSEEENKIYQSQKRSLPVPAHRMYVKGDSPESIAYLIENGYDYFNLINTPVDGRIIAVEGTL